MWTTSPQAADWTDVLGPAHPGHRRALIVATPGTAPEALLPLAAALQLAGVDAWTLTPGRATQDPVSVETQVLPKAFAALGADGLSLVGVGLGGTMAAATVQGGRVPMPSALALLGAPLDIQPTALTTWLSELAVPPRGLDSAQIAGAQWRGASLWPLLMGQGALPSQALGARTLQAMQKWIREGRTVDLSQIDTPIWVGVGALDNLAPPEAVRPWVGQAEFVRFGRLRLGGPDPDHAALLRDKTALRLLARWVAQNPGRE